MSTSQSYLFAIATRLARQKRPRALRQRRHPRRVGICRPPNTRYLRAQQTEPYDHQQEFLAALDFLVESAPGSDRWTLPPDAGGELPLMFSLLASKPAD